MNKITLTVLGICLAAFSFGQSAGNEKLIELGKAYKNYMVRNEPPKEFVKELQLNSSGTIKLTTTFIIQAITTNNDLLKQQYLTLPDNQTLKNIYIVRSINYNIREENQIDNNKLIDSLNTVDIPKNELVDCYYSMLFASVGNKIQPFNFSEVDFKLNDYHLSNDTEKGIFYLECMDYCGKTIWGYMNIAKPVNTEKAYDNLKRFPEFNGLKYFQFTDLNFPDFEMRIVKDKGKQSYKGYYINKLYDTLLSHLICLNKEGANEKDINDLLLGSILKDNSLYKYSKKKESLESIFKVKKQD